jgi:hypothetical protein
LPKARQKVRSNEAIARTIITPVSAATVTWQLAEEDAVIRERYAGHFIGDKAAA